LRSCTGLSKSLKILDEAVISQVMEMSRSGMMEMVILHDVKSRRNTEHVPKVKEHDKILLELEAMDVTFTLWADRLDRVKIDEDQFEMQNTRLLARMKDLQGKFKQLDAEVSATENLELGLAEVRKVLQDFPTLWDSLEHEER